MAAPVDAGRNTTNVSTAAATWNVNLPASISSGNLLLAVVRYAAGSSTNPISGDLVSSWTELLAYSNDASDDDVYVYAKIADGSEGATDTITFSSSQKGCAFTWRITGHDTTLANIVIIVEPFTAANFDPAGGSLGATDDWLIILSNTLDGETQTFTAPTNWTNTISANSGTGGAAASNCRGAGAGRQMTAVSSVAPTAWTQGAPTNGGTHLTIGIRQPVTLVDADAEIAWTELEVPNANSRADVAWAEFEVPTANAQAEIAWAELEVPTANAQAEIAWTEVEVPDLVVDAQAEVAWTELEVPTANSQAEIAWTEFEVPTANAQAEIAWAEFEVPTADARADIAWAEVEIPDFAIADAQAEISWTELEVPTADARADIAWAELEVPFVRAGCEVAWAEFEVPFLPGRADVSFTEFEVLNANAWAELSWAEFEVPTANSQAEIAHTQFEVPDVGGGPGGENETDSWERLPTHH